MEAMQWISITIYFVAMLLIGLFAYRTSTSNMSGYILGGRKVSPHVTALSAGASDMSGWMLMGLPGAMFLVGYETIYIALGLLVGALLNYLLVAPRLRIYTKLADDALTLPEFFSSRFGNGRTSLRITSAIIIVVFFTLYTSAGLVAGGKLFESAFDVDYHLGLMITMSVVVAYTLLGGFLAVSMTDFVQGCIMFVALILVPVVAYQQFSSFEEVNRFASQSIPTMTAGLTEVTVLGIIGSLAWGLGYFGQPHIIVRFMAIRSVADIPVARNIGISWMLVTIIGALGTGLIGVAYANKFSLPVSDPETIFIIFSEILFHPLISGFLMAAILAAIMSTISSQLLVSASSLTEDLYHVLSKHSEVDTNKSVLIGRCGVAGVAVVALLLSLDRSNSILNLVSNAWAGFGAAFGPLVLFSLYKANLTYKASIAGIITGAVTVLFWIYAPVLPDGQSLSSIVYEIIPGFIASTAVIAAVSVFDKKPSEQVTRQFAESLELLTDDA